MRASLRPPREDVWLTCGFVVLALVEVALRDGWSSRLAADGLAGASLQLVLLLRRTHPLAALTGYCSLAALDTVAQARLGVETGGGAFVPIVALLVLCCSLGMYGDRRALLLGCPQPVAVVVLVDLLDPSQGEVSAAVPFFALFVVSAPVLAGRAIRSRRMLTAQLARQEEELAEAHQQVLANARAHEESTLRDRLDTALGAGLTALLDDVRSARAGSGSVDRLETGARDLLAATRESVVALAESRPDDGAGRLPPGPPARIGDAAQPWAAMIAAAVGVGTLVELDTVGQAVPWGLLLSVAVVAGLAASWRFPLVGCGAAWLAAAALGRMLVTYGEGLTGIGLVVGTGFLVAWVSDRRAATVVLVLCAAGSLAADAGGDLDGRATVLVLAWIAGRLLRSHTLLLHRVQAGHAAAESARAAQVEAALVAERAAAARELHDSLGHSLTVVALQAGAARRLQHQDPARAAAALAVVEDVLNAGLADLRSGLRAHWDPAPVVAAGRDAGHDIVVRGEEPPPELAAACQRVLQESVTNAMRHAPGSSVVAQLSRQDGTYRMTITSGPTDLPSPPVTGGGTGLAGMRKRLAELGGHCDWGPADDGFVVRVELPVPSTDPDREPVS